MLPPGARPGSHATSENLCENSDMTLERAGPKFGSRTGSQLNRPSIRTAPTDEPSIADCTAMAAQPATVAEVWTAEILRWSLTRASSLAKHACNALVGLLTSEFGPSGLLVFLPALETGMMILTMARRLDGPLLLTKHSVTAAGPSRNRTGFPVRRTLPRERPTTNAQFKLSAFYCASRKLSSRFKKSVQEM